MGQDGGKTDMTKLIDGKVISAQIKDEVKQRVEVLKKEGKELALAVIQVGDDPASGVYVNNKKKACAYVEIGRASCRERVYVLV